MMQQRRSSFLGLQGRSNLQQQQQQQSHQQPLDMAQQRQLADMEKRRKHEEWCQAHQQQQVFSHQQSRVRALILVAEARRMELRHLKHQEAYCKKLIRRVEGDSSSPSKIRCESESAADCPCLRAPIYRQLLPKFRAMNLLQQHFADCDLERTVETLQQTYNSDHDMMNDLLYRYGPEGSDVDPHIWMRSIQARLSNLNTKWKNIARCVECEMRDRDAFPVVIRNLSIMRIFLEGSQAPTYSCDASERSRRDAFHQAVLDELDRRGCLFLGDADGTYEPCEYEEY